MPIGHATPSAVIENQYVVGVAALPVPARTQDSGWQRVVRHPNSWQPKSIAATIASESSSDPAYDPVLEFWRAEYFPVLAALFSVAIVLRFLVRPNGARLDDGLVYATVPAAQGIDSAVGR